MKAIPKISSLLNMGQEELEKESVKAYLHIKLRHGESEMFNIAKKYEISSIEEFEGRYKKGEIEEEEKVILLEEIGGRRLAKSLIKPAIIDFVESVCPTKTGEASLESLKIEHGAKIANKRVKELRIKEKIGATLIAIIRGETVISNVGHEDEIREGDTMVVIGEKNR